MNWRPKEGWDATEIASKTIGYETLRRAIAAEVGIAVLESYEKFLVEAGADAIHQADIEWFNKQMVGCTIDSNAKPPRVTCRDYRIFDVDWEVFKGE